MRAHHLVAVVMAAGLGGACSGDRRDTQIIDAQLSGDTLTMSISACNASDNRADVDVHDDEIVITVSTNDEAGGDDCADGLRVTLPEPLDGRPIVDGSTGDEVELTVLD